MVQEFTLSRILAPFLKENPKIVKPRKSWVVLKPSFRFSHLDYYNEYIVDIYQNAHSNALNNSWNNGWSGGLLQLAVGDDAAARAARRHALLRGAAAR